MMLSSKDVLRHQMAWSRYVADEIAASPTRTAMWRLGQMYSFGGVRRMPILSEDTHAVCITFCIMSYLQRGLSVYRKRFDRPSVSARTGSIRLTKAGRQLARGYARSAVRGIPRPIGGIYPSARRHADELKYLDIAVAPYSFETDATRAVLINGIAAGSTSITRVGNQCYWKSIQIRGYLSPATDGDHTPSRADLYVVYDDQPGAAVPTNAEILSNTTTEAFMNLDYRDRFRVVAHQYWVFGSTSNVANTSYSSGDNTKACEIYKKCNLRTNFKGVGNLIGDISKGALYILTMGNQSNASGDYVIGALAVRLRFTEA
nr:MAG: putative capsid protein [Arizlama virus]QXP07752.1 MAG: putative capsid protein [Arizlama virus]